MAQPAQARVRLLLRDGAGKPVRARTLALLLEHAPAFAEQVRLEAKESDVLETELRAGDYTLQLFVEGFEILRQFMNVEADKDIEREVALTRRTKPIEKPKLEERLKPYALAPDAVRAELTLKRDMRVALDDRFPDKSAVHNLAAGTVADLKRWLGSPDNVLGHDRPKFGTLPDDRILEGVTVERFPPSKLTAEQRVALAAISREYLYGNSTSVSKYSPLIDGYFKSKFDKAVLNIPLYGFSRVETGPGATLEIGGSSSVFFTSLLRIHTTGTLSVVGSVKADIGRYEEFS